ncbi:ribulose-phosphate 3-epimerase [Caldithrix abyssi DSM 13497]|uniref:Ribulose-phosphate 3-epimerase n=1 Tax=Caldithrix abyssi DSM 13497 TaxID=880073 RepID=H1XWY2_CALAY|nr:ribulose-phosphate 3-epimerase [Caldithrix abyssi]APF19535.1 ribulose-phosphate 3-epimerase [Caldithrix abyssi DSM 13497]EHO39669.1 ribulose-phosphate 3-epimerase [Caldithrix abyssi DSM 13497]
MAFLAPSILSADLLKLEEQIAMVEKNGADLIHVDVMDGHFVPNMTFGPSMVKALKKITRLPLDVHLMVSNPMQFVEWFAAAGADYLTIHQEACWHLDRAVKRIKALNCKAGISLNPATPVMTVQHLLKEVDLVLVMSVNPGFGGQAFIPYAVEKIATLNQWRSEYKADFLIEVDGGIDVRTAKQALKAGADVLVAGSSVFNNGDIARACRALKSVISTSGEEA